MAWGLRFLGFRLEGLGVQGLGFSGHIGGRKGPKCCEGVL